MSNPNYRQHNFWIEECYQTIQTMIGRQLRLQYEVSQEIPHQLLALLVQLNDPPDRVRTVKEAPTGAARQGTARAHGCAGVRSSAKPSPPRVRRRVPAP